ncbi:MAG TPA: adenylyltransferase/cytidyltransferase family protein [Candidatus Paceibacterota bacterium]
MKNGKKVGITAGAFDLCHAGHMLMFEEAKTVCDYLIVALHTDPSTDRPQKNHPIMSVDERMIILKSVRWIDEIITYDTEADLLKILTENSLNIDIRILGIEYKDKSYTGRDLPMPVYYNTRGHNFSSTQLRKRVYEAEKACQQSKA